MILKRRTTAVIHIILAALLIEADTSSNITKKLCNNSLLIENKYYTPTKHHKVKGLPADLSINWSSGNIFFTLVSSMMHMTVNVLDSSGRLEEINIADIGQSTAVDNCNNIVYIGTDKGVCIYDDTRKKCGKTIVKEDVMYLDTFENDIYMSTWPNKVVVQHNVKTKMTVMLPHLANVHSLTIDREGNVYFEQNDNGRHSKFVLRRDQKEATLLSGLQMDSRVDFFLGYDNIVYAMDEDSNFYNIDANSASANLLGTFGVHINTFAITKEGNVILGADNKLIEWVVSNVNPCTSKPK